MGLFNLFSSSKSNVEILDDRIWQTRQAKFAGILAAASQSLTEPNQPYAILLVAMFEDCLAELQQILDASHLDQKRVMATLAEQLSERTVQTSGLDDSQSITIIVAERHPLKAHNTAIADFARTLPCRCRLVYHVSLEDAVIRSFAGEWVQSILQRLGMDATEAIESRMVGRRIQQAVAKIEDKAVSDLRAGSAEDWMQLNCPDLWREMQG